jgi:hypothetical protein
LSDAKSTAAAPSPASEKEEKPGDLIPVTEYLEIVKFFDEAAKSKAGALIWTKDQENTARTSVISLSQSERAIYVGSPATENFPKLLLDLQGAGARCFLNIKLQRATLFCVTQLAGHNASALSFRLPEKIFKVQRRQNPRFTILPGYVLRLTFKDPRNPLQFVKQKIHDISAGGLSFLVDSEEGHLYESGRILELVTFTVKTKEFKLKAEVVHSRPVPQPPGVLEASKVKVGVRYLDIAEADSQILEDYVNDENRKFFSRFI